MGYRSVAYYLYTVFLKAMALVCGVLNRLHVFDRYQQQQKSAFQILANDLLSKPLRPVFHDAYRPFQFRDRAKLAALLDFDDAGVAMYLKGEGRRRNFYNPLTAAMYGLVCHRDWLHTRSKGLRETWMLQAVSLQSRLVWEGDRCWLPQTEDFAPFELRAPWHSGISQAIALSLFLRLYRETGDADLIPICNGLVNSMLHSKNAGGLLIHTPECLPWIEEYPSERPSMVLNGFLFCLIGLLEFRAMFPGTGEVPVEALLQSLFASLHRYCFGPFTRYSLYRFHFANVEYQGLLVYLFLALRDLTGFRGFHKLARTFSGKTSWRLFNAFMQIQHPGGLPD